MINPTGGEIRNDSAGQGHYGARRGSRLHKGVDYVCTPEQPVVAPIAGVVTRKVYAYVDDPQWVGLEIRGKRATVKLLYVAPLDNVMGRWVEAGANIGLAQDISKRYSPQMTPHVHTEITHLDPACLVGV